MAAQSRAPDVLAQFVSMNCAQLRDYLKKSDMPTSGNKGQLRRLAKGTFKLNLQ